MDKLVLSWFVLLSVTITSVAAQSSFPVGAVVGTVFGVLGACIGLALPLGIWLCIFCGVCYASNRERQRPVNSFVVSGNAPQPPPGSYPTQPQPTSAAYPSAYPVQPPYPTQAPTDPAYPVQPSAPGYPDAPPPYDAKQPL